MAVIDELLIKIKLSKLRWDWKILDALLHQTNSRAFYSLEMTQDQQAPDLLEQTLK